MNGDLASVSFTSFDTRSTLRALKMRPIFRTLAVWIPLVFERLSVFAIASNKTSRTGGIELTKSRRNHDLKYFFATVAGFRISTSFSSK